jgi:hypothetical protein
VGANGEKRIAFRLLIVGLRWEKSVRLKPPHGMGATYWPRIIQCRRCAAFRDGEYMRLLTIAPVHDSTYGRN